MTALITGATGFLGVHIIEELLSKGFEVIAVVRPGSAKLAVLSGLPIEIIELGLSEINRITQIVPSVDYFLHLAWEGTTAAGRDDENTQKHSAEAAIEAARTAIALGAKAFVFAGSQAEYGLRQQYGRYKLLAGDSCTEALKGTPTRFIRLKIFSLYGIGDQNNSVISAGVRKLSANEDFDLTACEQLWDFLHVSDAAEAIYALLESGGGEYDISYGEPKPLKEFILRMKEISGSKSLLNFGAIPYPAGGPVSLSPDITNLVRDTNWSPKITFEQGIKELFKAGLHYGR